MAGALCERWSIARCNKVNWRKLNAVRVMRRLYPRIA
jgi:hypothetical protein